MATINSSKKARGIMKGNVTRADKALFMVIGKERPIDEIKNSFAIYEQAFNDLKKAHQDYLLLVDVADLDDEDEWLSTYSDEMDKVRVTVQDYITKHTTPVQPTVDPASIAAQAAAAAVAAAAAAPTNKKLQVKVEKTSGPKFSGNVLDFYDFRKEFKFVYESEYGLDEQLYILNRSIPSDACNWITSCNDINDAWDTLKGIYGDTRVISDTILKNISRMKPLPEGDANKLVKLYHEINKAKNILKELDRESDLDNSTTLATIEGKLCYNDRMKWAQAQVQKGTVSNINNLLKFLNEEILIRRIAGADIRSGSSGSTTVSTGSAHAFSADIDDIEFNEEQLEELNANFVGATAGQFSPDSSSDQTSQHTASPTYERKCWICKETLDHRPCECKKFLALDKDDRLRLIKKEKACIFCINRHSGRCRLRKPCDQKLGNQPCAYSHHQTLHGANFEILKGTVMIVEGSGLLPIIAAELDNPAQHLTTRGLVFLDSGATISLIKNDIADKLQLKGKPVTATIGKIGNIEEVYSTKLYTVHVRAIDGKNSYRIKAIGLPEICSQSEITEIQVEKYAEKFKISPERLKRGSGTPDLLIGIDHIHLHHGETVIDGNVALRTSPIGPVLFGIPNDNTDPVGGSGHVNVCVNIKTKQIVDFTKFIESEEMGIAVNNCCTKHRPGEKILSPESKAEYEDIRNSAKKIDNQWYMEVQYDKNIKIENLKNNFSQAFACLIALEKRLRKAGPGILELYHEQIMDMSRRECIDKLSKEEQKAWIGIVLYLTHNAVFRWEKVSTPCRPVYNSSLKFKGLSLNDTQMKGPDLLMSLLGVYIRFRENIVAVCGDLFKMFQQVRYALDRDIHLHRFLWRNGEDREPDVYAMKVLIFGDKCSPALANTAVNLTAEEYLDTYPEAALSLLICRYVDDICESYENAEIAKQRTTEMDEILASGHFKVKSWISNVDIGKNSKVKTENENENSDTQCLDSLKPLGSQDMVLGTSWDRERDKLKICAKLPKEFTALTKRTVFSICAGVYDILGYTAPFVIRAKIAMQETWAAKLDWDTELPEDMKIVWNEWFEELKKLKTVEFDRSLTPHDAVGKAMLIISCDSSIKAFGAVAHIRWTLNNGKFTTRFVMAKSRVAPLRQVPIPRLELNSCVLAARLNETIKAECRLEFEKTVIFSDSRIALAWIKSSSRQFSPYVAVRVGEIQNKTSNTEFRHIPSEMNVADILSRGCHINELENRWARGDDFLLKPENQWPEDTSKIISADEEEIIDSEKVKNARVNVVIKKPEPAHELYIKRFSTLRKAIFVTAVCHRFVENAKTSAAKRLLKKGKKLSPGFHYIDDKKTGDITIQELKNAENHLVRNAQKFLLPLLQKNEINSLNPTLNENGILVVKGRTCNLVAYENYAPPILPRKCWLSKLIVRHVHKNRGHPGIACCAAKVRRDYWILSVTRLARVVKNSCLFCIEWSKKTETQLMADLPKYRLQPHTPPFYHTAVDLFGPMKVKVGRNKTDKMYGVLFTCLMSRAVYIDLSTDYSTPGFLFVLRRFFSIRGQVHTLHSDRGSQLVGTDNELRRAIENWDIEELKKFCHNYRTKWEFFTPTAAHQNGCAESLVKTTKLSILRAIGDATLAPMELQTILFEVANLMNQRPIGRLPNDPDDGHYLSPNDLLLGRASNTIPQGPFFETKNPRHRYEFCQQIVDSWWSRWYRDVFPDLVPRKKWHTTTRNVAIGDFVLVKDQNEIRGHWTRGIIEDVFPGNDGKVRNVKVKTVTGHYERPITKITVLYPVEGYGDENDID